MSQMPPGSAMMPLTGGGSGGAGGTVTDFSITGPAEILWSVATSTTTPAVTGAWATASGRKFIGSPSNGSSGVYTGRAIVYADVSAALDPVYQPLDADLTAIAALSTTSYGRGFLTRTDAAAAATYVGVGTGDSPQFAAVNVGHASDTTITRSSAGVLAVEGAIIYAQGGALGTPASGTMTNVTGTASGLTAGAATVLATARTINGTSFDGSANIVVGAIPQNSQSAAYTTVLSDGGKHVFHPAADVTARNWTIDSNANVAYPVGTTITFVNQHGAGVITIKITSDTMRLAGAGTTGDRTLAADGIATALKITSTEWIISGAGLT